MGRAGIGIVRLSGPGVEAIAVAMLGSLPPPRQAVRRAFRDTSGELIDSGIAIYFPAPGSYTGESVLELQGHGGQVVMDFLLEETLNQGARLARPGEFTYRSYMNDKLDLAQAEAVADVIDSASREALRSAQRTVLGEFSQRLAVLGETLMQLRAEIETDLDFTDEDKAYRDVGNEREQGRGSIKLIGRGDLWQRVVALRSSLAELIDQARQGCLLRDGVRVVIAGRSNVGKSSLLNRLSGEQVAIVADQPGTTRDLLKEQITIAGLPVQLIDTAGFRAAEDQVERLGIGLAEAALHSADLVMLVEDDCEVAPTAAILSAAIPEGAPLLVVRNKIDLTASRPAVETTVERTIVWASALTGSGIDLVRNELQRLVGYRHHGEGAFIARRRHLVALEAAFAVSTKLTSEAIAGHPAELVAEDLRQVQRCLGEITGEVGSEDLLERIFASFCIGK